MIISILVSYYVLVSLLGIILFECYSKKRCWAHEEFYIVFPFISFMDKIARSTRPSAVSNQEPTNRPLSLQWISVKRNYLCLFPSPQWVSSLILSVEFKYYHIIVCYYNDHLKQNAIVNIGCKKKLFDF